MCIICKMGDDGAGLNAADEFLREFGIAQQAMRKATEAMLACSRVDENYDRTHKQMVRLLREWNGITHTREHRPEHQS